MSVTDFLKNMKVASYQESNEVMQERIIKNADLLKIINIFK